MDYEDFARASYKKTKQERYIPGYEIIDEFTTDDKVVYKNKTGNNVVISFRGTDTTGFKYLGNNDWASGMPSMESPKDFIKQGLKSLWYSRSFRDISTDLIMGAPLLGIPEFEQHFSRFQKSRDTTRRVIQKYGKDNVTVVGHSLGGSQTMEISREFGIKGVAINPYVGPQHLKKTYPTTDIIHNITDPISIASPFVRAHHVEIRYDKKRHPTIGQHGLPHKPTVTIDKISPSTNVRADIDNKYSSTYHLIGR